MRYHIGLAPGHTYTDDQGKVPETPDSQPSDLEPEVAGHDSPLDDTDADGTHTQNLARMREESQQPNDPEPLVEGQPRLAEVDADYESDGESSMNSMDRGCDLSSSSDGSGDEVDAKDRQDDDELVILREMY